MKVKFSTFAAAVLISVTGAACASPLFVRDSTYRDSDIKFLVSDGSYQYLVRCDWTEVGGELQNCRKLNVRYAKSANVGGAK